MFRIDELTIMISGVLYFHFIEYTEDSNPMFLCKTTRGPLSRNLLANMVFRFPTYAVNNLKAYKLGNYLPFYFSGICNNKQGIFDYKLVVLLES